MFDPDPQRIYILLSDMDPQGDFFLLSDLDPQESFFLLSDPDPQGSVHPSVLSDPDPRRFYLMRQSRFRLERSCVYIRKGDEADTPPPPHPHHLTPSLGIFMYGTYLLAAGGEKPHLPPSKGVPRWSLWVLIS